MLALTSSHTDFHLQELRATNAMWHVLTVLGLIRHAYWWGSETLSTDLFCVNANFYSQWLGGWLERSSFEQKEKSLNFELSWGVWRLTFDIFKHLITPTKVKAHFFFPYFSYLLFRFVLFIFLVQRSTWSFRRCNWRISIRIFVRCNIFFFFFNPKLLKLIFSS